MIKKNKKYASQRMKINNPSHTEQGRNKLREISLKNGYKPNILGGNGRVRPVTETKLSKSLGKGWEQNYVFITHENKGSGYPFHYKLNIANLKNKIAVIGLNSNKKWKKKKEFMESKGWKIFRFSNKEIIRDLNYCKKFITDFTENY